MIFDRSSNSIRSAQNLRERLRRRLPLNKIVRDR